MKKMVMAFALVAMMAGMAYADQYVNGYFKSNGTYVQPYVRSTPDSSYNNNYSVRGNTNPYTGEQGSSPRTYNDKTPEYNNKTYGNPGYESSYGNSYGNSDRKSKSPYGY